MDALRRFFRRAPAPEPAHPGVAVVQYLYQIRQAINARHVEWTGDGFIWSGDGHPQRVWTSGPVERAGATRYLVHAETELVQGDLRAPGATGVVRALLSAAGLSGLLWDAQRRVLKLGWTLAVDGEEPLAGSAAYVALQATLLQVMEGVGQGAMLVARGGMTARLHPRAKGWTPQTQRLIALKVMAMLGRANEGEAADWAGSEEVARARQVAPELAQLEAPDGAPQGAALGAALPFGALPSPAGQAVLLIRPREAHPLLGEGALLTLHVPVLVDAQDPVALPLWLNQLEHGPQGCGCFAGSWCLSPAGDDRELAFALFAPNVLYSRGLLSELVGWMVARARWAGELFGSGRIPAHLRWEWGRPQWRWMDT